MNNIDYDSVFPYVRIYAKNVNIYILSLCGAEKNLPVPQEARNGNRNPPFLELRVIFPIRTVFNAMRVSEI